MEILTKARLGPSPGKPAPAPAGTIQRYNQCQRDGVKPDEWSILAKRIYQRVRSLVRISRDTPDQIGTAQRAQALWPRTHSRIAELAAIHTDADAATVEAIFEADPTVKRIVA